MMKVTVANLFKVSLIFLLCACEHFPSRTGRLTLDKKISDLNLFLPNLKNSGWVDETNCPKPEFATQIICLDKKVSGSHPIQNYSAKLYTITGTNDVGADVFSKTASDDGTGVSSGVDELLQIVKSKPQ